MVFWHLGGSLFIARWVFRDPGMDLRFVAVGAVLPAVVDVPLGSLVAGYDTHRLYGHTLLAAVGLLFGVMIATRRGASARKRGIGLAIGVFTHLILDVPLENETLWWPFLGTTFPASEHPPLADLIGHSLSDPIVLLQELIGVAYLIGLVRKTGLGEASERRRWAITGTLPL